MAIVLQKPQITGLIGSTIQVAHPDISEYTRTFLAADLDAADTSMSVYDNQNFEDDDFFLIGYPGDSRAEECDVNGAVTRGTALTITNSTKFNHTIDDPVTRIFERQIRIYGNSSASESGATLIATENIEWSRPFSELTITGTNYDYYYVTYYDGTTESAVSDFVAATGLSEATAQNLIEEALGMTGARMGQRGLTKEYLVGALNEGQKRIINYKDPDTNSVRNWGFEEVEDDGHSVIQYEHRYALTGLDNTPKFTNGIDSFQDIWVGRQYSIKPVTPVELRNMMIGKIYNECSGGASIGATTLDLVNASEFFDDGTVYVRGMAISYTGKSGNTLTGIPAAGTGSITTTILANDSVWQTNVGGNPAYYTVKNGFIEFDVPFSSEYAGYPLYSTFFKQLTPITELTDATDVDFYHILPYFVAYKIEVQRKNKVSSAEHLQMFLDYLDTHASGEKSNLLDVQEYWTSDVSDVSPPDNWPNAEAGRNNPVA